MTFKTNIRKNDLVAVIAGKEKGKTGKVLKVIPAEQRAVVEKLNLVKKHQKPNAANRQGGIIQKEQGIHISNLMLVCPKTKKPTRVALKIVDGKKVRISKKSGEQIPFVN